MMRFSTRDLFWAILVAALAIGWWIDRSNFRHAEQVLLQMVTEVRMQANDLQWKLDNR